MTETGRDYWVRVFTGQAMQAIVGRPDVDLAKQGHIQSAAGRAVAIAKETLDALEFSREHWIHHNYKRE